MSTENRTKQIPLYATLVAFGLLLIEILRNVLTSFVENWLSDVFIHLWGSISSSYFDAIHADIGKGIDQYSSTFYTIFYILVIFAFIGLIGYAIYKLGSKFRSSKRTRKGFIESGLVRIAVKPSDNKFLTFIIIVFLLFSMSFFVGILTYNYAKNNYNNKAVTYIERTLTILYAYAPEKIPLLRARYRAIDDACSYQIFEKSLIETRESVLSEIKKDGIKLPSFKPYFDETKNCGE